MGRPPSLSQEYWGTWGCPLSQGTWAQRQDIVNWTFSEKPACHTPSFLMYHQTQMKISMKDTTHLWVPAKIPPMSKL